MLDDILDYFRQHFVTNLGHLRNLHRPGQNQNKINAMKTVGILKHAPVHKILIHFHVAEMISR